MHCILCGYDLSHAPDDRCSECGARFDRDDDATWSESPLLVHRLLLRAPRLHAAFVEKWSVITCRNCGEPLSGAEGDRCPSCESWYDRTDMRTVAVSFRFVPRAVRRFRHVAIVRGLLVPLALAIYGLVCIATDTAHLPGGRHGWLELSDSGALAMGVAWLGLAAALHACFFWGRVEPIGRIAPLATVAGGAIAMIGWIYAVCWGVNVTLG